MANSEDPDQMLHVAASGLGLYCLPATLLGVFGLKLVNEASVIPYLGPFRMGFIFFLVTKISPFLLISA